MRTRNAGPATLVVAALVLGGCSGDADVSVRAGRGDGGAEVDVRTEGSTTTTIDRPSTGATDRTVVGAPEDPVVGDDALTGPSAGSAAAGGPAVGPVVAVDPGAPLGTALLASGPTGWGRASDAAPDLGALTVVEAAQALGDPEAELALLTTRRLRSAHARRWAGADGATATVVAYQFADAEGALAYEVDSMISLVGAGAAESTGAAMSRAFRWEGGGETIDGRSLRRGDRLYLVIVRQGTPALADALVVAQATQLAG